MTARIVYNEDGDQLTVKNGVAISPPAVGILTSVKAGANSSHAAVSTGNELLSSGIGAIDVAELPEIISAGGIKTDGMMRGLLIHSNGSLIKLTMQQAAVMGVISNATFGFGYGQADTTGSLAIFPLRKTAYTEQTTASRFSLSSSSSSDSSTGTGARQVKVTYYTASGNDIFGPYTETVSLNGTTNVQMVETSARFVDRMDVVSVGSGGVSAGTITLKNGSGATIGTITAGQPSTQWAHHYVPTGRACYIDFLHARTANVDSMYFLRKRQPTVANSALQMVGPFACTYDPPADEDGFSHTLLTPVKIVGPQYVELSCKALATTFFTALVDGSFSYVEVDV